MFSNVPVGVTNPDQLGRASARSIIHFYNMELDYFFLFLPVTKRSVFCTLYVKKQINRYVTVIMIYYHIVIIFSAAIFIKDSL